MTQFDNAYQVLEIAQLFLSYIFYFLLHHIPIFWFSVAGLTITYYKLAPGFFFPSNEVKRDYRIDLGLTVVEIYSRPEVSTSGLFIFPDVAHVTLIFYVMPISSLELSLKFHLESFKKKTQKWPCFNNTNDYFITL